MSALFSDSSVWMILAKATLVLLAAMAATRIMERGSAVSRHLVWFVSLGALLLIPVLASWSPIRLAILPPEAGAPLQLGAPAQRGPSGGVSSAVPIVVPPAAPTAGGVTSPSSNVEATVNTVRDIVSPDTPWFGILSDARVLFAIWASVAVLFALWLAHGAFAVHRIVRRARALDTPEWTNPLWEVADRLGLSSAPRLVRSDDAKMPFACGLVRPTIVLPAESDGWTLDRRRAVLLHELAHVRRRDLVGHTVGRFACALYWFHPLVWTAAKRLRSESERACDDLALNCGARASDYAEHLLDIVTGVRHHATPAVALAMARRKEFEGRMLAILDPELRRGAPSRKQTAGLVGGLAVLSLVVGAAVPVARAADGSVRPTSVIAAQPSSGSDSFRDEAVAQSVRTVERQTLEQRIDRTIDSVRVTRELAGPIGSAVGSKVGSTIGKEVGTHVGATVGAVLEGIVSSATGSAMRFGVPTAESLAAAINSGLAKQGRADDRPALLAGVLKTDTSASLRRVAAWGLAQFADADVAAEALASALRSDREAEVREMAAWALANARSSTAVTTALTTALRRDASSKVRSTSAWALASVGDRDVSDDLVAALGDTSRSVRVRAVWALGHTQPRQAPKQLVDLLADREADVRKVTAWALFNIQDPDAVPAIDAALRRETDKDVQRALIRALASTGERSVEAIKRLIDSNDPEVRAVAIRALAGGGSMGPWPWPWPEPRPHP